jgi:hypothetical protein
MFRRPLTGKSRRAAPWIYADLTDGIGRFGLSVELHDIEDVVLGKSESQELIFSGGDQLNVKEVGCK